MSLKKFLEKYEDLANELVKCGSCQNILLHCGKYEIVKIGNNKQQEGLLCESCKKNNRKVELSTIVTDNHIFQVPIILDEQEKEKEKEQEQDELKDLSLLLGPEENKEILKEE